MFKIFITFFILLTNVMLFAQKLDLRPISHRVKINGEEAIYQGFINSNGDTLIEPIFQYVDNFNQNGTAKVIFNDKIGIIDTTGKFIIPAKYDDISYSSVGLIPVNKDGLWGFIDQQKNLRIPHQYNGVSKFFKGEAYVLTQQKAVIKIDTMGIFLDELFYFPENIDVEHYEIEKFLYEYKLQDFRKNTPYIIIKEGFLMQGNYIQLINFENNIVVYTESRGPEQNTFIRIPNINFAQAVKFGLGLIDYNIAGFEYSKNSVKVFSEFCTLEIIDNNNGIFEINHLCCCP